MVPPPRADTECVSKCGNHPAVGPRSGVCRGSSGGPGEQDSSAGRPACLTRPNNVNMRPGAALPDRTIIVAVGGRMSDVLIAPSQSSYNRTSLDWNLLMSCTRLR